MRFELETARFIGRNIKIKGEHNFKDDSFGDLVICTRIR